MNLSDWNKLSIEEKAKFVREKPMTPGELGAADRELGMGGGKCAAGLLELRNQLKRQISEERDASSQYREASTKLIHYEFALGAQSLHRMAGDEFMHSFILEGIVDYITQECGE